MISFTYWEIGYFVCGFVFGCIVGYIAAFVIDMISMWGRR